MLAEVVSGHPIFDNLERQVFRFVDCGKYFSPSCPFIHIRKPGAKVRTSVQPPGLSPRCEPNGHWTGLHSTSRRKRARGTSRHGRELPCVNFRIDFSQRLDGFSARRKILFELLIPTELILADDVSSEFGQLRRCQILYRFFNFRQTHLRGRINNSTPDRNQCRPSESAQYSTKASSG